MDVTIILLWVVVLLIMHLLVEKALQMKVIAETFMNAHSLGPKYSLEEDIKLKSNASEEVKDEEIKSNEQMESELLNFLMNGETGTKQTNDENGNEMLVNHTNMLKNSGKFANLNTYDSIASDNSETSEQFSTPM